MPDALLVFWDSTYCHCSGFSWPLDTMIEWLSRSPPRTLSNTRRVMVEPVSTWPPSSVPLAFHCMSTGITSTFEHE